MPHRRTQGTDMATYSTAHKGAKAHSSREWVKRLSLIEPSHTFDRAFTHLSKPPHFSLGHFGKKDTEVLGQLRYISANKSTSLLNTSCILFEQIRFMKEKQHECLVYFIVYLIMNTQG